MPTPHINAQVGDFAKTVLMPGDPLRAKLIAEKYLDNVRQVTDVRNMLGFTGEYQGKPLSVMGHGMGVPSVSIYSHELYSHYGVENIIRIGSCGAISEDVKLMDIIIAMGASTDSNCNRLRFNGQDFAAIASYPLLAQAAEQAKAQQLPVRIGNVFTADLFYTPQPEMFDVMEKYGILGVEMEAAGLYGVAAELGKNALCMLTVSDHIRRHEALSAQQRQESFGEMMQLALATAITL